MVPEDSKEAVDQLFDQYVNDVYAFVQYMLEESQDTEDIVQDVFFHAYRAWGRFRGESSPKTWLLTIARNCVLDEIRSRKRHPPAMELPDTIGTGNGDLSAGLEVAELLQQLPPGDRQLVVLRYLDGWTTEDVARTLHWSEGKVRTRLFRAMRKLRMIAEQPIERRAAHGR